MIIATKTPKCPNCGKPTLAETMPFCSKRCADVDLSRWFRGDYSVPAIEGEDMPDDEENAENHTEH
ncbi:MAG: DNA gyrase inhibitor YacG [Rickettsiales bacterium]